MDERIPELPGYEFIDKIAGSETSMVWTARQLSLDRIVAIKILLSDRSLDPEAMQQFRHEAMAAARLKDPGIVQIFDAGEYAGIAYIVMEHIPGGTVQDQLSHREKLPEEEALAVVQWVSLALRYAWNECRIIHCDIKPSNVVVSETGDIKITDLGIAQFVNSMTLSQNEKEFFCTPNYASPENITGKTKLDCRTDIYSLGAMFYQLITGEIPFQEHAPQEVLEQQLFGHLQDPRKITPDLSDSSTAVLFKMMAKSLNDRYQDWNEVLEDLRALRKGYAPPNASCAPGHSTVQLSLPISLPAEEPQAKPVKPATAETASEKKRLVVKKEHIEQIQKKNHSSRSSCRGCLLFIFLLIVGLVAAFMFTPLRSAVNPYIENLQAYIDYYSGNNDYSDEDIQTVSATAYSATEAGNTSSSSPRASIQANRQSVQKKQTTSSSPDSSIHSNPDYRQGLSLYNEARALYDQYQNGNHHGQLLIDAENKCREAIKAFQNAKNEFPHNSTTQKQIDRCFHLISDCHHSRQLEL